MTSHSARTMREVTETVVIHAFLYFWNKFLVQIPGKGHFKSGKSSVLQARNRSFVRRGFRRKVPICLSSTKLSEVVQDIAFDALAPDCSIQVLPNIFEILFEVFVNIYTYTYYVYIYMYIYIYIYVCVYVCVHTFMMPYLLDGPNILQYMPCSTT